MIYVILNSRENSATMQNEKRNIRHLCQRDATGHLVAMHENQTLDSIPWMPLLTDEYPQLAYTRIPDEMRTCRHFGQRKLLMSKLACLTPHAHVLTHVLCVGAVPGIHLSMLMSTFPMIQWTIYDPNFANHKHETSLLTRHSQCTLHATQFTTEHAVQFAAKHKGKAYAFLCEDNADDFMDRQREWYYAMSPHISMLKFKCEYVSSDDQSVLSYMDGALYLPVWGKVCTTETRLIIDGPNAKEKSYMPRKYGDQMHYFNAVARPALYQHALSDVARHAFCCCFDCKTEIEIWSRVIQGARAHPNHILVTPWSLEDDEIDMIKWFWRHTSAFLHQTP